MHRAFVATGLPNVEIIWRTVEGNLDKLAHAWTAMDTEACEATRVRGTQSEALLDRRMRCNESLVFEYGSYAIKPEARPLLDSLGRALGKLLADDSVRDNIDTIAIQGHTDERGSAPYNWDLSAKRATAVLDYLFESNKTLAQQYGSYFAASAYSKFRPINTEQNEAAYRQNRRIEVAVVPKDASIRKMIDDYMKTVTPAP